MFTYQAFRNVGRHPVHLEFAVPVSPRPHMFPIRRIARLSGPIPAARAISVAVFIAVLFAVAELELFPAAAEGTVEDLADEVEAGIVLVEDVVLGLSAAAVQAHFPELETGE